MSSRYIVIQAFPEGMVAVIRHTIHGLLLAEITGRKPVILWNSRFLYHNDRGKITRNGFLYYFQENDLSDARCLRSPELTFAPACWTHNNIESDYINTYRSNEDRESHVPLTPQEILSSNEDVIVYTHYQHLIDLIPLIPAGSDHFGFSANQVANRIYKKYFRLNDHIVNILQKKQDEAFVDRRVLGIHCRGSDKISEYPIATPRAYRAVLKKTFQVLPNIFLATDSQQYFLQFKKWYPELQAIDCERSINNQGIHFSSTDVQKAGADFLLDAYLLSKCDYHFGNVGSHMSYLVQAVLRDSGMAYKDFTNVKPTLTSKVNRMFTYVFPFWLKKIIKSFIGFK